jgi:hypothetical protein
MNMNGHNAQHRQYSVHVHIEVDEGHQVPTEQSIVALFSAYGEVQGVTIPKVREESVCIFFPKSFLKFRRGKSSIFFLHQ